MAAAVLLVVAGGAAWVCYRPAHNRRVLLAETEQALADNDLGKAEQAARQLLDADPDDPQALLLNARVLCRAARLGEARSALEQATRLGLPKREALRQDALITAGQDFARAKGVLQLLADERPDDAEVLEALARGHQERQRWHEAETYYSRLHELQPARPDVLLARANVRMDAKRFADAAADLRAYLRYAPADYTARLALADSLLNESDFAAADEELLALDQLYPGRAAVLTGLGLCAQARGDLAEAQSLLQQAKDKEPSSTFIRNELGNVLMLRKQYDAAIAVSEQLLQDHPEDRQAHLRLAQALRLRNRPGDADRIKKHEGLYQRLERRHLENKRRGLPDW
jgi:Flp pilus assembly protein TadD